MPLRSALTIQMMLSGMPTRRFSADGLIRIIKLGRELGQVREKFLQTVEGLRQETRVELREVCLPVPDKSAGGEAPESAKRMEHVALDGGDLEKFNASAAILEAEPVAIPKLLTWEMVVVMNDELPLNHASLALLYELCAEVVGDE